MWTFSTTWNSRKTKKHTQKRSSPLLSFHEIFSIIILQCIHYNMNIVTSNLIEWRVKYTNPFEWNYIDLWIIKFLFSYWLNRFIHFDMQGKAIWIHDFTSITSVLKWISKIYFVCEIIVAKTRRDNLLSIREIIWFVIYNATNDW